MALRARLLGTVSLRRGGLRGILLRSVNKTHGDPHAVLDLFTKIRVAAEHLLGGLSPLSKTLTFVGIPGTRLINDVLLDAKVKNRALLRDARAIHDGKLGDLKRRCDLVLDDLHANAVADDIAALLGISKKTIYTVFRDKESLFLAMVDYLFDSIKESERQVLENEKLSTLEKIRAVLGVLPESYREVDFRQLYLLREKYPNIYKHVEERLETGWETTISLLEQGMKEGVIRPVKIPIVKMMLEAALEQFFQRDILISNGISYQDGLDEVVTILVQGIVAEGK